MNKHPLRVLLVEDDEDDFFLTRDLLNEIITFDCQTEWAATYAAAQAAMWAKQFDVCLIDYRLGERTGLELLRQAISDGFRTPMIMLTGQDDHAVDVEAMEAGAADYLVKGKIEAATLARTIRYAVERKRAEEERHRFFTLSQDLIGTIGFDGYFKQVNPMWEKTFGYNTAEMMKKKIVEFIHPDDLALTLIEASHIADGKTRSFEVRMQTKDGSDRWFLWNSIPVIAEKVSYAVGRDITERKRAEEALALESNLLQALMDNIPDAIYFKDTQSRFVRVSKHVHLKGMKSPEDAIGKTDFDFFAEEIARPYYEDEQLIVQTGQPLIGKVQNEIFPDGTSCWVLATKVPIFDAEGKVTGIVGMSRDITDLKRTEEAAQDARDYLNRVINAVADPVFVKNRQHQLTLVNDEMCRFIGRSREEAIGKTSHELFSAEDADVFWEKDELAFTSGEENVNEEKFTDLDGNQRVIVTRKRLHIDKNGEQFIVGVSRDITEAKKTEEALLKNEAKFIDLFDNAPVAYHELDTEGCFTCINHTEELLLGYTEEELKGRHCSELIVETISREATAAKLAGSIPLQAVERTFIRKDGSLVSVLSEDRLIYDADGKVIGIRSTLQNISERKRAEKELQESETRYKLLFDRNPHPIWVYDVETLEFLAVNEETTRHYGYSHEEFQTLTLKELHPPEDVPVFQKYANQVAAGIEILYSVKHQKKNGAIIEVEIAVQPINFAGRRARLALITDITERKRSEKELQESQQLLKLVIDTLPQAIWWKDNQGVYRGANRFIANVAGFDSAEQMLGLSDHDMPWTKEETELYRKVDRRVLQSGIAELDMVETQLQFDGRKAVVTTNKVPFRNADGEIVGVLGTFADITEQRRADAALRESEYELRTLLQSMREGLLRVDNEDRIIFVNECFCEMVGYSSDELLETNWSQLVFDRDGDDLVKQVNERRREGISDSYEICLRKKSGEMLWVIVGGAPTLDAENVVTGSMGVFTDITERKQIEERLLHDAFHDGLTGLANRMLFTDHLQMTIDRTKRDRKEMFAVLFLDFDRFKVINDSLGHAEGDNLLKQIARRLEFSLRSGDLVARLGGDEFTILVNHLNDSSVALRVAERIQEHLQKPFEIGGGEIYISASIGIALSTSGHERAADMIRDADIAMYRAKAKGKAQHQVFDQAMHEHASKQLRLETEMRQALERAEFLVHYQPIINLKTETLTGFESLVRWKHPTRGMIPPVEFIGAAEENNLIIALGQWILQESCRQMRRWQADNPAASALSVSVNLSSKQFLQPDLAEQIAKTLHETGLDSRCLKLEITESHIMENSEMAARTMSNLRALGVELSLDDFGTGYSSLSYLHRLPVNYLKIDRSFVTRMTASEENREIVSTIVKLAQNLKMKVVAEGIETAAQLAQLKSLNCEFGQGYFFAKPLEAKAAEEYIKENGEHSLRLLSQPIINAELNM